MNVASSNGMLRFMNQQQRSRDLSQQTEKVDYH